jgi:hypothetical protein
MSNFRGRVVGPVIPLMAFQGVGPVRRGLGMRHLTHVYAKLDLTYRVQLAQEAGHHD